MKNESSFQENRKFILEKLYSDSRLQPMIPSQKTVSTGMVVIASASHKDVERLSVEKINLSPKYLHTIIKLPF